MKTEPEEKSFNLGMAFCLCEIIGENYRVMNPAFYFNFSLQVFELHVRFIDNDIPIIFRFSDCGEIIKLHYVYHDSKEIELLTFQVSWPFFKKDLVLLLKYLEERTNTHLRGTDFKVSHNAQYEAKKLISLSDLKKVVNILSLSTFEKIFFRLIPGRKLNVSIEEKARDKKKVVCEFLTNDKVLIQSFGATKVISEEIKIEICNASTKDNFTEFIIEKVFDLLKG